MLRRGKVIRFIRGKSIVVFHCSACVFCNMLHKFYQCNAGNIHSQVASFPGPCVGKEEREPGTQCSRMRQVPLVTCILLGYTKIMVNFCLPAERPHCRVILPVRHIWMVLKSETISL